MKHTIAYSAPNMVICPSSDFLSMSVLLQCLLHWASKAPSPPSDLLICHLDSSYKQEVMCIGNVTDASYRSVDCVSRRYQLQFITAHRMWILCNNCDCISCKMVFTKNAALSSQHLTGHHCSACGITGAV